MELVVSASTGAMKTLLPKLAEMLTDEYNLQKSVRDDIESLKKELEGMHGALEKVCMVPADQLDNQVKIWANEVRELSYDIEDAVDSFMVRVGDGSQESKGLQGFRKFIQRIKALFPTAKARHDITTTIQRIKKEIREVRERRDRYMVASDSMNTVVIDPRLTAFYEEKEKLVGIDGPRDELVKLIMQEDSSSQKQLKVVSIVGFGGLGKTTLANAVYKELDGQVFNCRAFLSVSLKPDIRRILKNMLSQLDKQTYGHINEAWDEKQLIDELRTFLQDKRYLIVIDDIWDKSAWKILRCAFVDKSAGSCLITTTRKLDVAQHIGGVYKLNQLSGDYSKQLFYKRICHSEDGCPPQLKEISNQILKKCGGVPLAIITIASLLANKPATEAEWIHVRDSIGSGLDKNRGFEEMRRILSLSYYDLPSTLKTCLLYISVYPEDSAINVEELIWIWAAEGFIHPKQGQSIRELGQSYCIELINRSMIQPADTNADGRIFSCRVHDMVLDLITAFSTEENFVTILDDRQYKSLTKKMRRLSIQKSSSADKVQHARMSFSHVRSVTAFSHINMVPSLKKFQVLRVLNLRQCESVENYHLHGLGHLVHLRYLGLRSRRITDLPEQIGNLQLLQTLYLRGCSLKQLPAGITELPQLAHLLVNNPVLLPAGVGNMRCLRELSWFNIGRSSTLLNEIASLVELRILCMHIDTWDESYEKPLIECLRSLGSNKIERLIIDAFLPWDEGHPLDCMLAFSWAAPHLREFRAPNSTFSTLPNWIPSLSNLSILSIKLMSATQEDIHILGDLPALSYLHLGIESALEEMLVVNSDHPFNCLTVLRFQNDVMGRLTFAQGALQRLRSLYLQFGVRKTRDVCGTFSNSSIFENLPALKDVDISIDCSSARIQEVEHAEAAIKKAAESHPNRPVPRMGRVHTEDMITDEVEQW